ncbi:hypothetical protein ACWPMX_07755 [Tsuneonella sp. HG094]
MNRISLVGLLRIDLPDATVRLCDGGFIEFDGETYTSVDPTFGTIASLAALTEGVGEEIPALELALNPAASSAPADLSQPGFQRSAVRLWIGEYDVDTGLLVGDPDLLFFGQIDQTVLRVGRNARDLNMTIVSTLERLFLRNEGNSLSPVFHKSVWPGETGHDNATGLTVAVAWGVEKSPAASSAGYAPGGAGGGGGGYAVSRFAY